MKRHHILTLCLALGLSSSCQPEQDFEKQFEQTEKKLQAEGKKIDKELAKQLDDANVAPKK